MDAEIKIYQSLWKNLLLVICCMIFAIGAIFIVADDNCKIITKICGGWLGVMFFGVGGLFICVTTFYNSIRHIPYLILYKDRVEIYVQFKGTYKVVRFENVKSFRLIKMHHTTYIAIEYKTKYISQKMESPATSNFVKKLMVFNLQLTGSIEAILVFNLTMRGNEICDILNERIKNCPSS